MGDGRNWMYRYECAMSPDRLPALPPMRQVGTDPAKPVWAIGFVLATSPEVCMAEAIRSRETIRNVPCDLIWC